MLYFLYNMMVHGNVRGEDGPAAAHGSNSSNCFIQPRSITAVSLPFRKHLGNYSVVEFFITVNVSFTFSVSLFFTFVPFFTNNIIFFNFFVHPLHHTLSQRTSHCLSASWNHNHNNCTQEKLVQNTYEMDILHLKN